MSNVPIPLANPNDPGVSSGASGWFGDALNYLQGLANTAGNTASNVAHSWFDYQSNLTQAQAATSLAQLQAQQAARLAAMGTTSVQSQPNAPAAQLTPSGGNTLGMPSWLLPVGLVVGGGLVILMLTKK